MPIDDPRTVAAAKAWIEQTDVRVRPGPAAGVFEIGISLCGTVAAGAYSAGVLDFLVEALDQWELVKSRPDVPQHSVRLCVLSASSGGAVSAATFAAALAYEFSPGSIEDPDQQPQRDSANPLYRVWVDGFDIHAACSTSDLAMAPLKSVLHEGPATNPLGRGLKVRAVRPWVDDPLTLLLTLTNSTGVPYSIPYEGGSERAQHYVRHADYARFEFYYGQPSCVSSWPDAFAVKARPDAVPPNGFYADGAMVAPTLCSWDDAWKYVRATSAFPVIFPTVGLSRPAWHYLYQPLFCATGTQSGTVQFEPKVFEPAWGNWMQDPVGDYGFLAVDGGVLDNVPVELARRSLAGLVGATPGAPDVAQRAVIQIDPMAADAEPAGQAHVSIGATARGSLAALLEHARFSTQDFYVAAEPVGRSRFLVTPVRETDTGTLAGHRAIAGAALGGFGGFLARKYRHHDFMLGRRNCQQFLRRHFTLLASNPSFRQGEHEPAADEEVPIIPLFGSATIEQPAPTWPTGLADLIPSGQGREGALQGSIRDRAQGLLALALPFRLRLLILLAMLLPSSFLARLASLRIVAAIAAGLRAHGLADRELPQGAEHLLGGAMNAPPARADARTGTKGIA